MVTLYYQIKIQNNFWCKRGLNSKSLIQSSETLPIELTRTHVIITLLICYVKKAKPKFTYNLWDSPCLAYYCALGSLNNSSSTIIWLSSKNYYIILQCLHNVTMPFISTFPCGKRFIFIYLMHVDTQSCHCFGFC